MFLKVNSDGTIDMKNCSDIDSSKVNSTEKNGVYTITYTGVKIKGAVVQPEKFDELIVPQLGYESDNVIIVRLVTLNRQVKKLPFGIHIEITKPVSGIALPAPIPSATTLKSLYPPPLRAPAVRWNTHRVSLPSAPPTPVETKPTPAKTFKVRI